MDNKKINDVLELIEKREELIKISAIILSGVAASGKVPSSSLCIQESVNAAKKLINFIEKTENFK